MALWRVQLRQAMNEAGIVAKWSNVYFIETLSDQTAAQEGLELWNSQRNMHKSRMFCYEIYASDLNPTTEVYSLLPVPSANQRGLIAVAGDVLPLFNVVRVDYPVVSGGRPSRKFYRLPLEETDQTNGTMVPATQSLVQSICDVLADRPTIRDESGNLLAGAVVRNITSRRLGKLSGLNVPAAPGI